MPKAAKKQKFKVILDPEFQAAVAAFVPVFGSDEDLSLVQRIHLLHDKLEEFDNTILRGGNPKLLTKKMKDALFLEKGLTESITRRNNDF